MHSMLYFFILLFVQVVVESIPVSSSAHVHLAQKIMLTMGWGMSACAFVCSEVKFDTLLHLMHLPTLLIALFFFRKRLFFLCKALCRCWCIVGKIIGLTASADIITVLFFIFFKLFPPAIPLGIGLAITACVLYSLRWATASNTIWNWRYALLLGAVQGVALLPGVSRFAAVYACACWLGLPQRKAFEITWLVQWPLILAACVQSVYVLWAADQLIQFLEPFTLLMVGIATLCGLGMFYLAAYLAREGKLWWFSFYMIVPIAGWLYLWLSVIGLILASSVHFDIH